MLIVDDNQTNRKILTHQAASWKMIPVEADGGAKALELLRAAARNGEPFDVALLDFRMPEMDGFELARAIKADAQISDVPLVLMPSFGSRGDGQAARDIGISAYLMKPVKQSQLFDCLATLLAESSGTVEPPDAPDAPVLTELVTRCSLTENKFAGQTRILIAEDNAVNQKVAKRQIENLGYRADIAANGVEALAALEQISYDIVLMDCQMPEMDGYEATAEIRRRNKNGKHTIIIAMTANALDGEREKCLAAGMDDYISKPINPEKLREMLELWSGNDSQTRHSNGATDFAEADGEAVDLSVLANLNELEQNGNAGFIAELKGIYLRDTTEKFQILRRSVTTEDAETLLREMHNLKGSSASMGARPMSVLCESFERLPPVKRKTEGDEILQQMDRGFERNRRILAV